MECVLASLLEMLGEVLWSDLPQNIINDRFVTGQLSHKYHIRIGIYEGFARQLILGTEISFNTGDERCRQLPDAKVKLLGPFFHYLHTRNEDCIINGLEIPYQH